MTLQLRDLAQLFNSMDPSPFHDRDLDADAEEFIVGWARELSSGHELELTIHLATPPPPAPADAVQDAVQHYFLHRVEMKQREFRHLMRRGRSSLAVGLLFLVGCLTGSELLGTLGHSTISKIVKEGMTIVGWVAMWFPLQIYLYDWWPIRDERRVMERLARMRVHVVAPGGADAPMGKSNDVTSNS